MDIKDEKYLLSLESLLDISILLSSELDYSKVIQSAILTCLGQVTGKFGAVYLKKPLEEDFSLSFHKGIDSNLTEKESVSLIKADSDFLRHLYEEKTAFIYKEGLSDVFDEIKPEIVFPLIAKDRIVGIMGLGPKYFGEYSDQDFQFLDKFAMITTNAIENSLLYALATRDTKTGLYLHHYFMNRLKEEIEKVNRYDESLSILMVDLDHFKRINDNYGHQAGDYVLETLGKLILDFVRATDLPCRFGGEEFVIMSPNTDEHGAAVFAERFRKIVEETDFIYNKQVLPVTASLGVSQYNKEINSTEEFMENADKALYLAKESGRNQIKTYAEYLREKEK